MLYLCRVNLTLNLPNFVGYETCSNRKSDLGWIFSAVKKFKWRLMFVGFELASGGELPFILNCVYSFENGTADWNGDPADLDTCVGKYCQLCFFSKGRLHRTWRDAKRRLAAFASGRLRHMLVIGQLLINKFVQVKLSNCPRRLRPVATFSKFSMTSHFGYFESNYLNALLIHRAVSKKLWHHI